MSSFSKASLERLDTCDPRLQLVMKEAIKGFDFSVLCGFRNKEDQDKACAEGKSKTPWPTSKHNQSPSLAVDIAPYPIDWNDTERFKDLAAHVLSIAAEKKIRIRWGGDFNMNGLPDDRFIDMPHFELVGD